MIHLPHVNPLPATQARRSRAAGFSLVELSVALAISAVVMMALGSAMVLASRALPNKDNPALASHDVGRVLEQLSTDLQHALHISEREARAITFTVADRTGDGSPQRMRYAWSGEPGDPLTWQLDDHDPVELLPRIDAFALAYEQQDATQVHPGVPVQGFTNVTLDAYGPANHSERFAIRRYDWIGQRIVPTLPPDTVFWHPTKVEYNASPPPLLSLLGLLSDRYHIDLRAESLDFTPDTQLLARGSDRARLLSSSSRTTEFSTTSRLKPGQPAQLVFHYPEGGSGTVMNLRYDASPSWTNGSTTTANSGNTWSGLNYNRAVTFKLYGTPYTAGPDQSLTRQHLTRVRITIQANGENHPRFDTAVHLPNRPGVLEHYWEADFRHDPTGIDVNADGEADWIVDGNSNFTLANLNAEAGTWRARQTLRTWPNHDFTRPTVIHLRLRHTSADGGAAVMRLYADRRHGYVGPVGVYVQRQSNGQQTLDLISRDGGGQVITLTSVPGLPSGFIDVRLVVLPARQTVHLTVNGMDHGTHEYRYISDNGESQAVELTGWLTDNVEFKHIRITVGGDT